ncbi:MAG: RNA polymerase factor sigma-54 [Deltaproteobacteria bacterium]|nr:RNA polymerase factor sigma-54 [Deltaproteobacteria bacterium]
MTPSLQQAIKLLQMTRIELQGTVAQELVENPVLEESPESDEEEVAKGVEAQETPEAEKDDASMENIDFDAYFGDYMEGSSYTSTWEERQGAPIENTLSRDPDLYDHLLWQLHMADLELRQREIAELVIGNLDPDGFLVANCEEIQALSPLPPDDSPHEEEPYTEDEVLAALRLVRGFDPPGIACRDLQESLIFQLELKFGTEPPTLLAVPPDEAPLDETSQDAGPSYGEPQGSVPTGSTGEVAGRAGTPDETLLRHGSTSGATDPSSPGADGTSFEHRRRDDPSSFPLESAADLDLDRSVAYGMDLEAPAGEPEAESVEADEELEAAEETAEERAFRLARLILADHWPLFLKRQFAAIAKIIGVDLASLEPAVDLIRNLELRPGRRFSSDRPQYIEPDVAVVKVGGEYVIQLNDDGMPRLRISQAYRRMLRAMRGDADNSEAHGYIKDKMRSALWLIKSLDQRQRTIYKVADSIVKQQQEFLEKGIDALRPMVLRDVAEDIAMHESTVSRVVSNKYIHTPRGLLPMKFFFHSGIDRDYGENISSLSVKRKIQHLIQEEPPNKPLSDSELMRILKREGIQIARRTVAKYRDELGIPSSTDRKQIF